MYKKSIQILAFIFFLSCAPLLQAVPNIALQTEMTIDDINRPTPPRGTQNWEASQNDFFIFPGIVLTLIALAYIFTKD